MLRIGCSPDPTLLAVMGFQPLEILVDAPMGDYLPRASVPCWCTTERIQGTDGVGLHSLSQRPFSWVWSSRDNEQAGCLG